MEEVPKPETRESLERYLDDLQLLLKNTKRLAGDPPMDPDLLRGFLNTKRQIAETEAALAKLK